MKPIKILSRNIAKNITLSNKKKYLITKEILVRPGVRLSIQDGTEIYILNGPILGAHLKRAALIFEPGSQLRAEKFTLKAANSNGGAVKQADNGGLWFCGNYQSASKDNISIKANRRKRKSHFTAKEIKSFYLGRLDPNSKKTTRKQQKPNNFGDDLDAISIMGVGRDEWAISSIKSFYSGDDGFDVTNSNIVLNRIDVKEPSEDGLNITSSRVQIVKKLLIQMGIKGKDRDLFDLETDDGGSYIEISKGCQINLEGVFGDELILSSQDMPKFKKSKSSIYKFNGASKKSDSLIYSITMD
jgi:hypothetical protein